MVKYSFLVPCFNGEAYIEKCLESLLKQKYKDFEIVVVDDGSSDNSYEILSKYKDKIRLYKQTNKGVSATRNRLISLSKGKYFLFVDIDDYIDLNTLNTVDKYIKDDIDILKFNYQTVDGNLNSITPTYFNSEIINGKKAIQTLIESRIIFDMPCTYVFNKKSYMDKHYSFEEGRDHEDFGLIPFVVNYSNKVILINDSLYYYYQSKNSLTRFNDIEKEYKKAQDILFFFKKYRDANIEPIMKSYAANAVILKYKKQKGKYKRLYKNDMKKNRVVDYLLSDTLSRKLKKIFWKTII